MPLLLGEALARLIAHGSHRGLCFGRAVVVATPVAVPGASVAACAAAVLHAVLEAFVAAVAACQVGHR